MKKLPLYSLLAHLVGQKRTWQEKCRARDRHLRSVSHLKSVAAELSARCLEEIRTLDDWERQRPKVRSQLQWMLGLDPLPARTPLDAQVTGVLERPEYRVEKLVFQSLPDLYVTGNFYVPHGIARPAPCVLYLCGHVVHPLGAKTQFQDRFLWYPAHGFACLVLDALECGEIQGIHHGTHDLNRWDWLSLGYTPAGVEVWNAMRALDWLGTRGEVDATQIGVTGISGGGVMTWFLAALDGRVKAAAPSCSTYTIGSQAALNVVSSQCDCTYYPNVFGLDFPILGALIAPRPLLITSGKRDGIFPPAGSHEVFRRARRVYDLYPRVGEGRQRIREVESNEGHTDPPFFLHESRRWMCQWLWPENGEVLKAVTEPGPAAEPAERLVCLEAPPPEALNYSIQTQFLPAPSLRLPASVTDWQQRREYVLQELKQRVFSWFPREPAGFGAREVRSRWGRAEDFAFISEWVFDSEPGAPVRALLFRPKAPPPKAPLLILIKRWKDWIVFPDDELLPLFKTHHVVVLNPRFTEWSPSAAEFANTERTAAMMGRTLAAVQVWDVMRVVNWVLDERRVPAQGVSVYGRGAAGIVGLYAALFQERIDHVILNEPPASHREGPALLTVLRTTDIPEAAAALAPRHLSLLSALPPPFEFTRSIYRLCGVEDRMQCFTSLPAALHREEVDTETPSQPSSGGVDVAG